MRPRWRPAPLLLMALLTACGGNRPPLATIERVPGSTTHEIKPLDSHGREIVPLDSTPGREVRPLEQDERTIRPLGSSPAAGREIAPLDTLVVPVDGTTWHGSNYEGALTLEFLIGGILRYTTPNGTWSNGTWHQQGNSVAFEMNSHYADYSGRIRGTRMSGAGHNRAGRTWDWQATRQ